MEEILKELKLLSDGEIRAKCKELEIKGFYPFLGQETDQNQSQLWSNPGPFRDKLIIHES